MGPAVSANARFRPLLWVAAILFAVPAIVYSVAWMYYIRSAPVRVEVGMDVDPYPSGLEVRDVWKDGPAQKAGLQEKDRIIAMNGRSTAAAAKGGEVLDEIWIKSHPGDTVQLTVQRPGSAQSLVITPCISREEGGCW